MLSEKQSKNKKTYYKLNTCMQFMKVQSNISFLKLLFVLKST